MKILIVPLDERAVNTRFPSRIAESGGLTAFTPPSELMPKHKQEADIEGLAQWIEGHAQDTTHLLIAAETLFWGGLVPSRINKRAPAEASRMLAWLASLKEKNPRLRIALFSVITRASLAASKDEEPPYWLEWKEKIVAFGELLDRRSRTTEPGEISDYDRRIANLMVEVPKEYRDDYLWRRVRNTRIKFELISALAAGHIDFLTIGRDDTKGYGFVPMEDRDLQKFAKALELDAAKIRFLSGADELMSVLVGKMLIADLQSPAVYLDWLNPDARTLYGFYDGRPLEDVFRLQANLLGMHLVENPGEADMVMAIANPQMPQVDQWINPLEDREKNHREKPEEPNLVKLEGQLERVRHYAAEGKIVGFADVFATNGANEDILREIAPAVGEIIRAYSAINTAGNTAGVVLANLAALWRAAKLGLDTTKANGRFVLEQLLDSGVYQGTTRKRLLYEVLARDPYSFDPQTVIFKPSELPGSQLPDAVLNSVTEEIRKDADRILKSSLLYRNLKTFRAWFPWKHRLFIVDLETEL